MSSALVTDGGVYLFAWAEGFSPSFSLSENFEEDGLIFTASLPIYVKAGVSLVVDGKTQWRKQRVKDDTDRPRE